ncbi:uncharacterized protein LOC131879684 isoform X1 [Tigriopus californicus]|uniref:uncharacterized protein LOC131879684 isoform X1 n=1 Tax=Tigriopus californicus TaxID=6832 RepID=UPI0027D9F294|nr:uncharacterized protein LOC131879684 isoform X1 [Tigriopus californicus]XP_059082042.1 uncharacterized protein LOC131879684 isoform X1 [Tigriopus californicus]
MMSRGVNRFSYSRTGLGIVVGLTGLAIQPAMAFLPSWSDLFSSLRPFQDPTESPEDMGLDEESARLGFVQLNSGTNSFNTTLNLTGHILLGLGIASALLARMFLEALKGDSNQGGYSSGSGSGYGRRKVPVDALINTSIDLSALLVFSLLVTLVWSTFLMITYIGWYGPFKPFMSLHPSHRRRPHRYRDEPHFDDFHRRSLSPNGTLDEMTQLIPPLLEKLEDRLRLSGLDEDDCLTQTVCEANRPQLEFSFNTLGDAIRDIHGIILENMEQESEESLENDEIVIRHLNALTIGLEGKDCKMAYPKCSKPYQELMRILHS